MEKLSNLLNEDKYTLIDPKGNTAGTGTKDQANQRQKKMGGSKKGYFVVPAKSALKARRTLEKFKFDFNNPKLQDKMSDLYFESVNEGKHDDILDKLADIVKGAKSFMDIGKELKKNGIKYSFGTNMIPMYIIDKPVKIAILNNKYADGAERVVGTTAIGLMESLNESVTESMDKMQILQNFSVDVSKVIKDHIKDIKKLDSKTQKEMGRLIGDFKGGLDSISESVEEYAQFGHSWGKKRKKK